MPLHNFSFRSDIETWLQLIQLFRIHHLLPKGQKRSKLCEKVDCPYRGDPLIKVLKFSGDDSQRAVFQPINLKDVFDELSASVEGSAEIATGKDAGGKLYEFETRDKKDIVKKYQSLQTQKVKDLVKKCVVS